MEIVLEEAVVKTEEEFDGAEEALVAVEPLEAQLEGHLLEPIPWVLDLVEAPVEWWVQQQPYQVSIGHLEVDQQPLMEYNPWV